MERTEVLNNRVGDWNQVFELVAPVLTPDVLRQQLNTYINTPLPENLDDVAVFTARMNATMALARMVAANDRAAGTIAALFVANGIKPTSFDYGDDT